MNKGKLEIQFECEKQCASLLHAEERIAYLEELVKKYKYCSLTGFKKELDFDEDLNRLFEESRFSDEHFFLVMADINYLHNVNKMQGWKAGNALILKVAEQLKEKFAMHQIFRIGGDEFCMLVRETHFSYEGVKEKIKSVTDICYNISLSTDVSTASELFKLCDAELNKKKLIRNQEKRV